MYPRDLLGYGSSPPDAQWPGGARIAVQFVINFEEGGEHSVLHGDRHSEAWLTEDPSVPLHNVRNMSVAIRIWQPGRLVAAAAPV
ncbi:MULTISPECIES: hypothetical protein [unclassified Mesorhizobium]|uniref:hypothetical protein n=1 Tax=unclassified Mesorhizobium TaxID=325217 RepID=UPI0019D015D5|nr:MULTISPECIES: hypothetical protein [unclassified Mesorhizobium]